MSSKRNHAIRSRKTYKSRMNAARINLAGSPPAGASSGIRISRSGSYGGGIGFMRLINSILRKRNREKKGAKEA